ncbi:hypothetical protein BJX99DRAFT_240447 [Aspergillus californicus]
MASTCSNSARLSLPYALRTLFYSESGTLSRQLPCRSLRRFSTAPKTSFPQDSSPEPPRNESSMTSNNSGVVNQDAGDQASAQTKTSTTSLSSSRRIDKSTQPSNTQRSDNRNARKVPKEHQRDQKERKDRKDRPNFNPELNKNREEWQVQKHALKKKFPTGWSPSKKLSPDAIEGIRHLNTIAPDQFTTDVLAKEFKMSPEAIRRILKSKWRPSETELENRRQRWEKRHDRIWSHMSELGVRPHTNRTGPLSDAMALLYKKNKKDDDST